MLAAIEAVLHATGQVLSERRALVLGSRGAIGSRLVRALAGGRVRDRVARRRPPGAPAALGEAPAWRTCRRRCDAPWTS